VLLYSHNTLHLVAPVVKHTSCVVSQADSRKFETVKVISNIWTNVWGFKKQWRTIIFFKKNLFVREFGRI
jgi:hypothetical protein